MEAIGTIEEFVGAIPLVIGILILLGLIGLEIRDWWEQNPVLTIIALVLAETVIPFAILIFAALLKHLKWAAIGIVFITIGTVIYADGSQRHDQAYYQRLDAEVAPTLIAMRTPAPANSQCIVIANDEWIRSDDDSYSRNLVRELKRGDAVHVVGVGKGLYQMLLIDSPARGYIDLDTVRCAAPGKALPPFSEQCTVVDDVESVSSVPRGYLVQSEIIAELKKGDRVHAIEQAQYGTLLIDNPRGYIQSGSVECVSLVPTLMPFPTPLP